MSEGVASDIRASTRGPTLPKSKGKLSVLAGPGFIERFSGNASLDAYKVQWVPFEDKTQALVEATQCDVAIYALDTYSDAFIETLLLLPKLKWVHTEDAGTDAPLYEKLLAKGLRVTHSPGANAPEVAEFAFALLLQAAKRLSLLKKQQENKLWTLQPLLALKGKTILILGTGAIGKRVARMSQAFEMQTIGVRRKAQKTPHFDEVYEISSLRELLPRADALVLAMPLTTDTHHMIGAKELSLLRPECILVNIGRGKLIDMQALHKVLETGHLEQALCDVMPEEPLPRESPYWIQKGLTITPHTAYLSPRYMNDVFSMWKENLDAYLGNQTMRFEVRPR